MRRFFRYTGTVIPIVLSLMVFSVCIAGDVPQTLNYQGTLTNAAGQPFTGTRQIVFKFYNVQSGGSALWSQTMSTVTVTNGRFAVVLGPLDPAIFTGETYIGIKVGTDNEMVPRQKLNSVPYAFKSSTVVNLPNIPDPIPSGIIVMWKGAVNQIPAGWALCDGNNGTPDLRDRFVVGAGNSYAVGANAGNTSHSHTINDHSHLAPDHLHTIAHDHYVSRVNNGSYWSDWGSGLDTGGNYAGYTYGSQTNNSSGASDRSMQTGEATDRGMDSRSNLPPYYALAYIMKL